MDEVGIWAQVLYPNVAGFGSQRFLKIHDDELKLVCVRAYNDFLRDWASADARRLLTIMTMPFWDIDETVTEVERNVDAGHRGILFTGEPHRFGLPYLGEAHWDPLWSIAQEAGLPIHFHIGSGEMTSSFGPERIAAHGTAATYAYTSVELFLKNGLQCADLITSGVLPRFPDLKFVSVESGIGWIPFVLEAADHSYLEGRPGRKSEWELLPSEYFARQVYATYWFEQVAPTKLLGEIPVDHILFETDFPHPTCLYGNVHEKIETSLAGATDEQRRRILWAERRRALRRGGGRSVERDPGPEGRRQRLRRRACPTSRPVTTTRAAPAPGARPGPESPVGAPAGRAPCGRSSGPAGPRPRGRRPAPHRRCRAPSNPCSPRVPAPSMRDVADG